MSILNIINWNLRGIGQYCNYSEDVYFSRALGLKFYEYMTGLISTAGPTSLVLNFTYTTACDLTFLDEFVVKLQLHIRENYDFCLILSNVNELIEENIAGAISLREEKGSRVPILVLKEEQLSIIGKLDNTLQQTFAYFETRKKVTAKDIIEAEGVAPNFASNRLKKLYDYRLIDRISDKPAPGMPFIYHLPFFSVKQNPFL